jgi:3-oxoacyl-[acyl-carrier protein] reductase
MSNRWEGDVGKLSGKAAIVTGGSRGIGAAISKRLAADGASVAVNYSSSEEAANAVVAEIKTAGGVAVAIHADVTDPDQLKQLFVKAHEAFGRLDILVNNAGVGGVAPVGGFEPEDFDRVFDLNVKAALFATQEAVALFPETGGRIINISSGVARVSPPYAAIYSGSKAALESITRSNAYELGMRNITVNAVAPGITDTDMVRDFYPPDRLQRMINATPLGRLGQPDDIADVVAFLASDEARWVTAQTIDANGGLR